MSYKAGQSVAVQFITQSATGAKVNADALPTAVVVRNGDNTAESVTVTNLSAGVYKAAFTIPASWAATDTIELRAEATVGGIAGAAVVWQADLGPFSVSVSVTPIAVTAVASQSATAEIGVQQHADGPSVTFTVLDNSVTPPVAIDLTGETVELRVFNANDQTEVHTFVSGVDLTIATNQVTVSDLLTTTDGEGVFAFELWRKTNGALLLASGRWDVARRLGPSV